MTERVKEMLSELCGIGRIEDCSRLTEELGLDSLSMVTMLLTIEDTFGIVLDESDMDPYDLITVSDVISLVTRYTGDCYE